MQALSLVYDVKSFTTLSSGPCLTGHSKKFTLSHSLRHAAGLFVGLLTKKGGVYVSVLTAQRRQKPGCSSSCRDPRPRLDQSRLQGSCVSFVLFPEESVLSCEAAWIPTALPAVTVRGRRWGIRTTHTAFRSEKSTFVRISGLARRYCVDWAKGRCIIRMSIIRTALRWGGDARLLSIIVHVCRLFPLPLVTQKPSQWDDIRLE